MLEHPADSYAWDAFDLPTPARAGGWVRGLCGGWSCHVEQGHYGHRAKKATWLYAVRTALPDLAWGASAAGVRLDDGFHSADERRRAVRRGITERAAHRERAATPRPFAELLVTLARTVDVRPRAT